MRRLCTIRQIIQPAASRRVARTVRPRAPQSVRPELDVTNSHSTRLSKDASQVAGYVEGWSEARQLQPFALSLSKGECLQTNSTPSGVARQLATFFFFATS